PPGPFFDASRFGACVWPPGPFFGASCLETCVWPPGPAFEASCLDAGVSGSLWLPSASAIDAVSFHLVTLRDRRGTALPWLGLALICCFVAWFPIARFAR